jgi:hypothetical protein
MNRLRVLLFLCIVLVLSGAVQAIMVKCIGSKCDGPVLWDYCYEITLTATEFIDNFTVGIHSGCDIKNIRSPDGWGHIVSPSFEGQKHNTGFTPHGQKSSSNGNCDGRIGWSTSGTPLSGGTYDSFSFDSTCPPHDVGFMIKNDNTPLLREDWKLPVGMGFGPVHSPVPEPATICLFGLGGLLLRRRKSA